MGIVSTLIHPRNSLLLKSPIADLVEGPLTARRALAGLVPVVLPAPFSVSCRLDTREYSCGTNVSNNFFTYLPECTITSNHPYVCCKIQGGGFSEGT
jgi:hypothetical protein